MSTRSVGIAGAALVVLLALPGVSSARQAGQEEMRPSLKKRQTPGGPPDGDVAAIKDRDGMVIIWNRSKPFFTMKVVGRDMSGFGEEAVYFTVDDVFLQVLSVEADAFVGSGTGAASHTILEAHRDWDFKNMKSVLGEKSVLRSSRETLTDGTPVLYWEVTPEKRLGPAAPSKYLMVSRVHAGSVIGATSVEVGGVTLARAKALVFDAISHVELSTTMIDVKRFQKELESSRQ